MKNVPDDDIDVELMLNKMETFAVGLLYKVDNLAKSECKKHDMPENVIASLYINLFGEALRESTQEIARRSGPEAAMTFLGTHMKTIQEIVLDADYAQKSLEKIMKNKEKKR